MIRRTYLAGTRLVRSPLKSSFNANVAFEPLGISPNVEVADILRTHTASCADYSPVASSTSRRHKESSAAE